MNLKWVLENTASRFGKRDAVVYGDRRLSYSYIDKESNRFADALLKSGIGKNDRVALFLSNSPEFIISFFGIIKTGAIALPLDQQYKLTEIKALFTQAVPAAIVSENTMLDVITPAISEFKSVKLVIEAFQVRKGRYTGFTDFVNSGSSNRQDYQPSPDDVAVIMYTSSPTFQPKGVMLTHESLVKESIMSSEGYHQTENDVMVLFALPMFHVFGLVAVGLASIYSGSTLVIVPGTGLSLSSCFSAIEREKGTMFLGVPYIFALAVDMAEKTGIHNDLSSLRLWASAGAPLSVNIAGNFKKFYGRNIMDCYGLTEAVCHVTCPDIKGVIKPGSIGKPLAGWKIKIIDENGNELPSHQSGEIIISGPVMKGYFLNSEATKEAIKDGWLFTGDIGMKDDEGFLYITGRKKATIIVKGQNIYPSDVESVISACPGVDEVAVMGIPDKMRGEIVAAVISLREGSKISEQEIRQFCQEKITGYKIPKKIIFTSGPMPKAASGEIDKTALRKKLAILPVFPVL